ncbi:hypothetical protein Hanom_Chr08g00711401 [Helianthus anomalus]
MSESTNVFHNSVASLEVLTSSTVVSLSASVGPCGEFTGFRSDNSGTANFSSACKHVSLAITNMFRHKHKQTSVKLRFD